MRARDRLALLLGLLAASGAFAALLANGQPAARAWTAAVAVVCACWWVFEPIPIPITSMLPLALLPLVGVLSPEQLGAAYGSPLILLLLGGFVLSKAMEHSGAHRRLALNMVRLFGGGDARRLVLGFMAAAALLSMWISNTATTLMLLPVALAVLGSGHALLAPPLLLGIAYAASIGGIGTPIGTPPNLVFMQVYGDEFGTVPSFTQWMSWALPLVLLFVPLAGLWLTRNLGGTPAPAVPEVGPWQPAERRTLIVFALTALAWVTRREPFGGWSQWLNLPQANDASVALLAVVALFVIPDGRGGRLLSWQAAERIPWGVLILFGGGIAIAKAFSVSGLSALLGEALAGVGAWPLWLAVFTIALSVTLLTEITSNTAAAVLLMPILALAALAAGIDPRLLMLPAAMSASCAFMLPVATAPNAIVYGSGVVSAARMAREGLLLNLVGATCVTLVCLMVLG